MGSLGVIAKSAGSITVSMINALLISTSVSGMVKSSKGGAANAEIIIHSSPLSTAVCTLEKEWPQVESSPILDVIVAHPVREQHTTNQVNQRITTPLFICEKLHCFGMIYSLDQLRALVIRNQIRFHLTPTCSVSTAWHSNYMIISVNYSSTETRYNQAQ